LAVSSQRRDIGKFLLLPQGTLQARCAAAGVKNRIHFRIGEPIGAARRKVKRAARFAGVGWDRFVSTGLADFAFDLNHIKDVFGSDMVRACFFRYAHRHLGDGKGNRWQDTPL
jgi:hypothetical protein